MDRSRWTETGDGARPSDEIRVVARLRLHVPDVALVWMAEDPEARARIVEGTLCFADVSGFTALAERLEGRGRRGTEELIDTLNRVFGAILEIAADRGGSLLKFGGDALLFLFQGPDHALRAAATATAMHRELRRAANEKTAFGRLTLSMSVGMASGEIHLFLVGSTHRELVIAGPVLDATIVAEGVAVGGETLLDRSTAALLPEAATASHDDGRHARLRWRGPRAPTDEAGRTGRPPADLALIRALLPSPLIAALASGVEPGHRSATISFVRLSGSDALLDEGVDVLADALDVSIGLVEDSLAAEGLTLLTVDVDRDGVKCFSAAGAPAGTEDDEGRMLRALRMIVTAELPLQVQAGVNRGHVFVAEIGSSERAAVLGHGRHHQHCPRIAGKAPAGSLYAHGAVLERARIRYESDAVGPFQFKGKREPLVVYAVGRETGPREDSDHHQLPMLGRDDEVQAVLEAIGRVRSGTGGVLTIPVRPDWARPGWRRGGELVRPAEDRRPRGAVRRGDVVPTVARPAAQPARRRARERLGDGGRPARGHRPFGAGPAAVRTAVRRRQPCGAATNARSRSNRDRAPAESNGGISSSTCSAESTADR